MATRGRKPTPTSIKILEGNPGKRPLNKNEPKPESKAPPCPKWLNGDAKKEWHRLARKMERLGTLTEHDMAAFAAYCVAYAGWKKAQSFLDENGEVYVTANGSAQPWPQVAIAQKYYNQMERCAEQFGLTPSSRSRIMADRKEARAGDEMEDILNG